MPDPKSTKRVSSCEVRDAADVLAQVRILSRGVEELLPEGALPERLRRCERERLGEAELDANAQTCLEQFFRVLEREPVPPRLPVEIHHNGEWFASMRLGDVIRLTSQHTVARMLEPRSSCSRFRCCPGSMAFSA